MPVELDSVYLVTCPKQGLEMEAVVLHRVAFLEYFCPKQGQDFKPSAAPLYPNIVLLHSQEQTKKASNLILLDTVLHAPQYEIAIV